VGVKGIVPIRRGVSSRNHLNRIITLVDIIFDFTNAVLGKINDINQSKSGLTFVFVFEDS
jgi:hypothetical protein